MPRLLLALFLGFAPACPQGARHPLDKQVNVALSSRGYPTVHSRDIPSKPSSLMELLRMASKLRTKKTEPHIGAYTSIKVASATVSTQCSFHAETDYGLTHEKNDVYRRFGHACGIQGLDKTAVDAHIERVWRLICSAYQELNREEPEQKVLKVFLLPEWALGRRFPKDDSAKEFVPPLNFEDMQHIILTLREKMLYSDGYDFTNWLMVPGSIYWGVEVRHARHKYAIFNTAPIFYGGELVWAHNKYNEADGLNPRIGEVWGFDFVRKFSEHRSCFPEGKEGLIKRICGTIEFMESQPHLLEQLKFSRRVGHALFHWVLIQPAYVIMVNGLAVGLDICADHDSHDSQWSGHSARERIRSQQWINTFDIQLLIAAGMQFKDAVGQPQLMLRAGGVAVSCDGYGDDNGPVGRLFVAQMRNDIVPNKWYEIERNQSAEVPQVQLRLNTHFVEIASVTLNSWGDADGCDAIPHDDPEKDFCVMCNGEDSEELFAQSNMYWLEDFCLSQAGNWRFLRVWNTPISLPPYWKCEEVDRLCRQRHLNGKATAIGPNNVEMEHVLNMSANEVEN